MNLFIFQSGYRNGSGIPQEGTLAGAPMSQHSQPQRSFDSPYMPQHGYRGPHGPHHQHYNHTQMNTAVSNGHSFTRETWGRNSQGHHYTVIPTIFLTLL